MALPPRLVKASGERKIATSLIPPPPPQQMRTKTDYKSGGADADVQFEVKGLDYLDQLLRWMPKAERSIAGQEMANVLAEILADSKETYVPRDTMALYDSGAHDEYDPSKDLDITQLAIWYAAPGYANESADSHFVTATDIHGKVLGTYRQSTGHGGGMVLKKPEQYALEQHENLDYEHPFGSAKYLEIPFNKVAPNVPARIADAISEYLGYAISPTGFIEVG
jgi:hypothetical protein